MLSFSKVRNWIRQREMNDWCGEPPTQSLKEKQKKAERSTNFFHSVYIYINKKCFKLSI